MVQEDRPSASPFKDGEDRAGRRIASIDVARGLVMVVMALDHCREYFHASLPGLDPTDPAKSYLLLCLTRWVTYFCAPTFVMLSGISAWLRGHRAGRLSELQLFLATRGAWLIFLELTLVGTGFTFQPGYLFLQVIWVIGAGFLVLSLACRLPPAIVLATGAVIIGGHDLLHHFLHFSFAGQAGPLELLDGPFNFIAIGPLKGVLVYSALGWIGILLAGYGAGPLFLAPSRKRVTTLLACGTAMIAAFLAIRGVNNYGDPLPWSPQPTPARQFMSFMRVSKYPPSLDYTLATLGPMLVLLALLERARSGAAAVLRIYGRVPFFFYLLHIYLIHSLATAAGMIQGMAFSSFTDPLAPPAGFGVQLWLVYPLWALVVAILYLPCRWFERLRRRRSDWWLSYL